MSALCDQLTAQSSQRCQHLLVSSGPFAAAFAAESGPAADGCGQRTPAPKRPATRDSMQIVQSGFHSMTLDDLTTAVHQLDSRVDRGLQFAFALTER